MLLDRATVTGISLDKIGHETATGGRAGVIGTEADEDTVPNVKNIIPYVQARGSPRK